MIKRFCDACKLEIKKPDLLIPNQVAFHTIELHTIGFNHQKLQKDGKYEICDNCRIKVQSFLFETSLQSLESGSGKQ